MSEKAEVARAYAAEKAEVGKAWSIEKAKAAHLVAEERPVAVAIGDLRGRRWCSASCWPATSTVSAA